MAEEEKPKHLVQMSTVIASGITAIIAALFTSRLGVAGTLIGTALTPMLMTIGVSILNAQIQKAAEKIPDLPSTVRGRLSTQRIRVPGTPTPQEIPEEPEPPVASRRRDMRTPGIFERLISIPAYLKEMSPSTRRRALLTGALAGLVAAVIGLAGVTGIEAASGSNFSCTVWERCPETTTTASGQETGQASTSISQVFGGSSGAESVPSGIQGQPSDVQQQEAQPAPQVQQAPQDQQYQVTPRGEDQQSGGTPEQPPAQPVPQEEEQPAVAEPEPVPQDGAQEEPSVDPGAEQQPVTPPEQQPATPSELQPVAPSEQQQ